MQAFRWDGQVHSEPEVASLDCSVAPSLAFLAFSVAVAAAAYDVGRTAAGSALCSPSGCSARVVLIMEVQLPKSAL